MPRLPDDDVYGCDCFGSMSMPFTRTCLLACASLQLCVGLRSRQLLAVELLLAYYVAIASTKSCAAVSFYLCHVCSCVVGCALVSCWQWSC